jgi:piezo-type mechanosensitive ion channel component 1/2
MQIRYGLPDWREPSSLTSTLTAVRQNLNLIYYNLPFLVELKTTLDWCFTKTTLDIFQWLELAEINNQMYNAKMGNSSYYEKKLGKKVSPIEKKICGCVCLGIMLFFLVGPFVFFSNMRFIAAYNPINDL